MATLETQTDPIWSDVSSRRPWRGLVLIAISLLFTLGVLIYFGAWAAQERIDARSDNGATSANGEWWEDGLIAICPIH